MKGDEVLVETKMVMVMRGGWKVRGEIECSNNDVIGMIYGYG
jgi:hypothetical protein